MAGNTTDISVGWANFTIWIRPNVFSQGPGRIALDIHVKWNSQKNPRKWNSVKRKTMHSDKKIIKTTRRY
jgi:hypothetical protein